MFSEIRLCNKKLSKYVKNMQTERGKANLICELEDHPEDPHAMKIYTLNGKKEKIFVSYVCKNNYMFTAKANALYQKYNDRVEELISDYGHMEDTAYSIAFDEYSIKSNWAKNEKVGIYADEELTEIFNDINSGAYRLRYDYDLNELYLFPKEDAFA